MRQVLFLCSANYYRSRFAEHLFNWLAPQAGLDWRAGSRGLAVTHWPLLRSMWRGAVEGLKERGVPLNGEHRDPQPLALPDLAASDLVVAMKESEHRPMMAKQFPLWEDQIEYWHIDDLDCADPGEALPCVEANVRELVERLAGCGAEAPIRLSSRAD
jgi:protein-tyrosine phosphatase